MMSLRKKIKEDIKTSQLLLPIIIFGSIYLLLKVITNLTLLDFATAIIPGYHINYISDWLLIVCSVVFSVIVLFIIKSRRK